LQQAADSDINGVTDAADEIDGEIALGEE
jgi:hypothetical protein